MDGEKMNNKKNIFIFLFMLLSLFTLSHIIWNVHLFNTGYQKFDLGHNMKYLNCEFETTITDISLDGTAKTSSELIQEGGTQLITSFYKFGYFCALFIIINLVLIIYTFYCGVNTLPIIVGKLKKGK